MRQKRAETLDQTPCLGVYLSIVEGMCVELQKEIVEVIGEEIVEVIVEVTGEVIEEGIVTGIAEVNVEVVAEGVVGGIAGTYQMSNLLLVERLVIRCSIAQMQQIVEWK